MCWSRGSGIGWRRAALLLFGLIPALHGCSAGAGLTSAASPGPAPMTPGAMVTEAWVYTTPQGVVQVPGTWVHLPADEAGELELWIERAEGACR